MTRASAGSERSLLARLAGSLAVRILAVTVVLALCAFVALRTAGGPEELAAQLENQVSVGSGFAIAAVLVVLQALIAMSPFPSHVAAIPLAFLFGFWGGAALVWTGWWITAFAQYQLVKRAASEFEFGQRRKSMPRWVRELPAHNALFLVALRWFPGGSHVVNSAAGAYGVSLARHMGLAAISIVPRALFVSSVANGLRWL
jgi:uncharacterized membrane protein YdjX (TVP38/TMEM64 family)